MAFSMSLVRVFTLRILLAASSVSICMLWLNSCALSHKVRKYYIFHSIFSKLAIDGADSKKLVQVENNLPSFAPPDVFLGVFLKKKRRSRRVSQNENAWNDDDVGCDS